MTVTTLYRKLIWINLSSDVSVVKEDSFCGFDLLCFAFLSSFDAGRFTYVFLLSCHSFVIWGIVMCPGIVTSYCKPLFPYGTADIPFTDLSSSSLAHIHLFQHPSDRHVYDLSVLSM